MKEKKEISIAVIKRLPRYYWCLTELAKKGETRISSLAMSSLLGFTASQVRQDLNNFGGFGQQGYGYEVDKLRKEIKEIIGLTQRYNMIIVGDGNIGRALSRYEGFKNDNFLVQAVFDVSIEQTHESHGVLHLNVSELENYVKNNSIDIAIISVPKEVAQQIADRLVLLNVKAIWNFAPADIKVPKGTILENINVSESLYNLSYKIKNS